MVDMIVFQSLRDIIDFYKFIHIYCSGEFFKLYGDKIDRTRFVKVFSKKPVAEIVKASYNDSAIFTKTDRVVRAICDVYNYRNKNKLPDISALK